MKTYKSAITRLLTAGLVMAAAAVCSAQTTNTIIAEYGTPPSSGSDFTIKLVNKGEVNTIAGFAFKLQYDPSQVAITGVINNTGQSGSGVQYTLGAESVEGATATRILSATTLANLKNATNLAEIKLQKKPGFAPPLVFSVSDRSTDPIIDGLQGASLENIPHEFYNSGL